MHDSSNVDALRDAATAFLEAFNQLLWEPFCAAFADDAVLFMPFASVPQRLNGKAEILASFAPLFAAHETSVEPPSLGLNPHDIDVRLVGGGGLVTFHLSNAERFGRRTLLFEKRDDQWLLVHLHASNLPPIATG